MSETSDATWRARARGALEEIEHALALGEVAGDPQYALDEATKALRAAQRWLTAGRQADRRRSHEARVVHEELDEMISISASQDPPLDVPTEPVKAVVGESLVAALDAQMHEAIEEAWQNPRPSLAEFLSDRIAEEEEEAKKEWSAAIPIDAHRSHSADPIGTFRHDCPGCLRGVWPGRRRFLSECVARRMVVELHASRARDAKEFMQGALGSVFAAKVSTSEAVLRALVQPYADHPDFDPAWRLPGQDD